MQINQNNTINGDSSNSKMLYVGWLLPLGLHEGVGVQALANQPASVEGEDHPHLQKYSWTNGSKGSIWDEKKGKKTC